MDSFDFIVIGGGIAGASVAYELAAARRVALLEREAQPGYHSTGRSAALYSQTYGNAVIRALSIGGWEFFNSPPRGFSEHPILTPRGAMFVGEQGQEALLEKLATEASSLVQGIYRLGAAEACARVPVLRSEKVIGAVLESNAMDIDVHALHQGFIRGFRQREGRLITDADVRGLPHKDDWEIETKTGVVRAPIVINAAGAWCDELAGLAGARRVGLQPKRRTAITFSPPEGVDVAGWPLTIGAAEDFYFKPDAGKLLGSPADETPVDPCDVQPEELDVAMAVHRIETMTMMRIARIEHKWAGLRTFARDNTPVVGFDSEVDGFFWLGGQGGYGIQTAPAMGRLAATLAMGGDVPADLESLGVTGAAISPRRFR